jgi:3-methyladenine DNA glycosylase AlkD
LRKLAKKIGRNRDLSLALWDTSVYEAKVISLLIDEPAAMTRAQAERQVEEVSAAQLSHVFSSCDASLA